MTLTKSSLVSLIKFPILTEKTIRLIEENQYCFAVDPNSNKTTLKKAIEELFDVKVISITTAMQPSKKRRVGKYIGKKAKYKKAIVRLDASDSIKLLNES